MPPGLKPVDFIGRVFKKADTNGRGRSGIAVEFSFECIACCLVLSEVDDELVLVEDRRTF